MFNLFSSSGILGFECLSRGAKHVTFIDQSREAISSIQGSISQFEATNIDIHRASIPCDTLQLPCSYYDFVFWIPLSINHF